MILRLIRTAIQELNRGPNSSDKQTNTRLVIACLAMAGVLVLLALLLPDGARQFVRLLRVALRPF